MRYEAEERGKAKGTNWSQYLQEHLKTEVIMEEQWEIDGDSAEGYEGEAQDCYDYVTGEQGNIADLDFEFEE